MSEETQVPPTETTPTSPPAEATPATPEAAAAGTPEESGEAKSFEKSIEGVKLAFPTVAELLEAGVHFGHQTRRWDPRMRNYLFGDRNGVHIIDLDQTRTLFEEALIFVREITANGGKVLFVGTKRQAQPPVRAEAERSGQYYVNQRWLGGMLTNFKTVKNSVERFKGYIEILGSEEKMKEHTKRELARIQRETNKLEKSLGGIKTMKRLPDAMFVVGMDMENIAIQEAHRLSIPVIGIADSNNNPDVVDFIIPGNDDATRAIQLYCARVADACLEGVAMHQAKLAKEGGGGRGKQRDDKKADGPSTGRVVVDIKATPKRGRGGAPGASAGGEKKGGRGKKGGKPDAKESVQIANPMAPRRRKKVEPKVEEAVTEEVVAAAEGEATETPAPEAVETQAPAVEETAAVTEAPAEETAAAPAEAPAETPAETPVEESKDKE